MIMQAVAELKERLTAKDRQILRELAKRVAEIGADPIQKEKADHWRRHNDLERVRPMVLAFPEGSWRELLPAACCVSQKKLQQIEWNLRTAIYYHDHMPDDNVIEPVVRVPIAIRTSELGLDFKQTASGMATGAYHIDGVIQDEADIDKICTDVTLEVDWDDTQARLNMIRDILGDILDVEVQGIFRGGISPLDTYSRLRGIDNMFIDLVDEPDMVHKTVDRLVQREINRLREAERLGVLTLGLRNHYAGSGGVSYTNQLPRPDFDGEHVRLRDLWGFATDQIFSEVSPAMHEEFCLRHEEPYLDMFGLNCYGCCEPLHLKLDVMFKHIPRLRRISISPWADVAVSAEKLQDKFIFSWKPNPADLAGEEWNPGYIRQTIRDFCEKTRGCIVEIVMKDTHTVRNQPQRMWDWVRIAKEVATDF